VFDPVNVLANLTEDTRIGGHGAGLDAPGHDAHLLTIVDQRTTGIPTALALAALVHAPTDVISGIRLATVSCGALLIGVDLEGYLLQGALDTAIGLHKGYIEYYISYTM